MLWNSSEQELYYCMLFLPFCFVTHSFCMPTFVSPKNVFLIIKWKSYCPPFYKTNGSQIQWWLFFYGSQLNRAQGVKISPSTKIFLYHVRKNCNFGQTFWFKTSSSPPLDLKLSERAALSVPINAFVLSILHVAMCVPHVYPHAVKGKKAQHKSEHWVFTRYYM